MPVPLLTPVEQRVLGALIEKRWTTPDTYPLSLNALRLACNQSTSRDPVTDYDEATVREGAQRLARHGLARLASGAGSRAVKYRHLAEEALGLERPELSVLCVLLLRGPQTPGELKGRTERMTHFASLDEVDRGLERLIERGYVARLGRRPGQKEERFAHLMSAGGPAEGAGERERAVTDAGGSERAEGSAGGSERAARGERAGGSERAAYAPGVAPAPGPADDVAARVATLEAEVAALRSELESLRTADRS